MMPPDTDDTCQLQVRSLACQMKYGELFREWENLALHESVKWTAELDDKLKGNGDVDDFFKWVEEKLDPRRPDFSSTTPARFRKMLLQANWTKYDRASQVVTGRLWYGNTSPGPDAYIGRFKDRVLALRLNAHIFNPREEDAALCVRLGVDTLLPHIFLGMRYPSTSLEEESPAIKSILLLGNVLNISEAMEMVPPHIVKIKKWENTNYSLALDLDSKSDGKQEFLLIYDFANDVSDGNSAELAGQQFSVARLIIKEIEDPDRSFFEEDPHSLEEVGLVPLTGQEPSFFELGFKPDQKKFIPMIPSDSEETRR